MNPLKSKELLARLSAPLPQFLFTYETLPESREIVCLTCLIPGGTAFFYAFRHLKEDRNQWYIQEEDQWIKVKDKVPEYWFPII